MTAYNETPSVFDVQTVGEAQTFAVMDDESHVFMNESLFLLPGAFDDGLLMEMTPHIENPEILYVAGDLDDDLELSEDEAVAILANYGQVRQFLHRKVLNRGFFKNKAPGSGGGPRRPGSRPFKPMLAITNGPGSSSSVPPPPKPHHTARPKMWTKSHLSLIHISEPTNQRGSRMPSSA